MKLQTKILLPILSLFVLLLGVSNYMSYKQSAENLRSALIGEMGGEARALARTTNAMMSDALRDIERNAANESIQDFFQAGVFTKDSMAAMSQTMQRLADSYQKFDVFILTDAEGKVLASSNMEIIERDFSNRIYIKEALRGKTYLSAPFISQVDKKATMSVSAPVKDGKNEIIGSFSGTLILTSLYDLAVAPIKVGERGFAYLVDPSGQVVASPDPKMLFNPNLPATPIYKQWLADKEDGPVETIGNNGEMTLSYHVIDPLSGLMGVVRADSRDVFADLYIMRNISIIISAVAILLGIIVVLIIVRPIVASLKKGVVFATGVAAGKLDGKLDVCRKDEIGQLADALRAIPASLNAIVEEYAELEKKIIYGELSSIGDDKKFSGDFAKLIRGTNGIMSRFRTILDNIPMPMGVFSKDLKATYLNSAGQEAAGSDYLGRSDQDLLQREDYGTPNDAFMQTAQANSRHSGETVAHPRGLRLEISYTAIPLRDEKGNLSAILQLVTDLTEIKRKQNIIIEVANQALDIANRVSVASEELSAQVNQVSQGTEIQRDRVNSTATAMEEMNSTVLEVARNAGQSREQAETMQDKADHGATMVRQVIAAIKQVNDAAVELESNMQQLGQQAEAIGSVMSVISDIADQTNLLALNAAIEAARAGEAGRGFAVVADEVRKLAEKTMGATSEVGSSIKGIQTSTASNIKRVSGAAEDAEKATVLANSSGEALNEILSLATANAALIAGIATAAEEQSATSDEINRSVDEINRITSETSQGMNESASAVQELSRMAQELNSLLDRLKA